MLKFVRKLLVDEKFVLSVSLFVDCFLILIFNIVLFVDVLGFFLILILLKNLRLWMWDFDWLIRILL